MSTATAAISQAIDPQLARSLKVLLTRARPRRIVETGTGLGLGTTLTICQALAENELSADQFYSIEVNPNLYAQAWSNLASHKCHPRLLRGLSIPRALMPSNDELHQLAAEQGQGTADARAAEWRQETQFADTLDDLLGFVLRNFDHAPDLVLLDSADYLGYIEFQYALSLIKSPCYLALTSVKGPKHARSLKLIESDGRFKLLEFSPDDHSYCLAHFNP